MSKTTYTAGVDLFLVDGEIFITEPHDYGEEKTIYSTKLIHDCPKLDRSLFVKGVDLEELAEEVVLEMWRFKPDTGYEMKEFEREIEVAKAGYQANKAEFTENDIAKAIGFGINLARYSSINNQDVLDMEYDGFLRELRPLSLPKSVTIDGDKIQVNW